MKPTLAQLKKRPALWVFALNHVYVEPRITMPDGSMWSYDYTSMRGWNLETLEQDEWHKFAIEYYDFAGWL